MPSQPYQRIIMNGVPMWKDTEGRLFYYESSTHPTLESRIQIGTEATGIAENWQTLLDPRLITYRETQVSRTRAVKK